MKEASIENIIPIEIGDYNVTFYGGKGFMNKVRTIIALYDRTGKLISWLKFHDENQQIETDSVDENGIITGNFPNSSYMDIIYTLRSNRPVQLIFAQNVVLLIELIMQELMPIPKVDKNKIN